MKKSLIALILLSALIGCNPDRAPVAAQDEQGNAQTTKPAGKPDATNAQTTAGHLSFVLGSSSSEIIAQEPNISEPENHEETEKSVIPAEDVKTEVSTQIKYMSQKDGFSVLVPSTPTVKDLDSPNGAHVRIYRAQANNGLIIYGIFCHSFEKKILTEESIRTYLDSTVPDRLAGVAQGQLIQRTITEFRGFEAKEFEYLSPMGNMEFTYKGIVFLIDGDSISLTMAYPKETGPEFTFVDFTNSFELLPLEPLLSREYWVNKSLGLKFAPPADMSNLNKGQGRNGLIVSFANKAGHTIGILDATVAYRGITWSDIQTKLSEMKDCGDGFYENIVPGTTTKSPMVQLIKCVRNGNRIYLIQAYAPQKTYFRSVQKFKASMKTLTFVH